MAPMLAESIVSSYEAGGDLAGTVALGLLSENMVSVSHRVIDDAKLDGLDYAVLGRATEFLSELGASTGGPMLRSDRRRLAPDTGSLALDAVRDVQDRDTAVAIDEETLPDYIGDLAGLLERARNDELIGPDRHRFNVVHDLFAELGSLMLKRADEIELLQLSQI